MSNSKIYLKIFEISPRLSLWTRKELPEEGMGVASFRNAVQYIRNYLL